ncbi:M61 family metallopeptidase [Nafulsella turpanensis]|uniref:M61 family metallopeptidase n=1 Tax=Nafulsella turpanensis TaxID=1265690 RepID=UPI00034D2FBC|nr:hypothetical protein [Nafulsella turpanensis]
MKRQFNLTLIAFFLFTGFCLAQENKYQYQVDLTQVQNDQLQVNLDVPDIEQKEITFHLPAIIPGTYRISNFGEFVSDLKAYDKKGRLLPVEQVDTNTWKIKKAQKLERLSYLVEDIFDTQKENNIYYMSGTNIAANENFVINPFGFFGYFENMREIPFEVSITKPEGFYGSTGLIPESTSPTTDVFLTQDYDRLADSPIMYNKPDTTIIQVGDAEVLVSVYSPNGLVKSEFLAQKFDKLLQATKDYLGGELPVDKYAFLLYFEPPMTARNDRAGALEHSYSSFYYLPEYPQEQMAPLLVDIAAHEFFHIVTPLTIHSEEIEDFNFNEANLSKHLWLYEGVTEYASDHIQVRQNLIPPPEFLNRLAEKINNSKRNYIDTLAFTELSEYAADKYSDQYGNVYEKGALIAALLDIKLLELSNGSMDLQDLLAKLSERYGKNKPFDDERLFEVIGELSYPEIEEYLERYVGGTESLPYEEIFAKVGVEYVQEPPQQVATLGQVNIGFNQEQGRLEIANTSQMNAFGRAIGFETGDLLLRLQGQDILPQTAQALLEDYATNTEEGDTVEIVVGRANEAGEYEEVTLRAPAQLVTTEGSYSLRMMENPTFEQMKLFNQWTQASPVTARPEDVASVDAIVNTLYEVISGPAGERNWERFYSLFKPDARMSAIAAQPGRTPYVVSMTPEEYQEKNAPFFMESGFFEEEIGREVDQFGEMAHVWSAYQFKVQEESEPAQRGINSIQLVFDQGRWWINSLLWNSETPDNQIPEELLEEQEEE